MGEVPELPNYERMYLRLAARVSDAIDLLIAAQRECEDLYIADGETESAAVPPRFAEQTAAMLKELLVEDALGVDNAAGVADNEQDMEKADGA